MMVASVLRKTGHNGGPSVEAKKQTCKDSHSILTAGRPLAWLLPAPEVSEEESSWWTTWARGWEHLCGQRCLQKALLFAMPAGPALQHWVFVRTCQPAHCKPQVPFVVQLLSVVHCHIQECQLLPLVLRGQLLILKNSLKLQLC